MNTLQHFPARTRQAGFTLVEMMVAVTIGLIVLVGMTASFVNLKNTFRSQDKLAQFQDNERLAMSILTTSLNEAGFHPNPMVAASTEIMSSAPTIGPSMAAGVGLMGAAATGTVSQSLGIAYAAPAGSDLMSCLGTNNAAGTATASVRNTFYVDTTTNMLMCSVLVNNGTSDAMANGGTAQPLISGIQSIAMQYGVAPTGTAQVNGYYSAPNVTDWTTVKSIRITLTFVNPFDSTLSISRMHTINLMN